MSGCQALHYTLKILLKIRGSLNVSAEPREFESTCPSKAAILTAK